MQVCALGQPVRVPTAFRSLWCSSTAPAFTQALVMTQACSWPVELRAAGGAALRGICGGSFCACRVAAAAAPAWPAASASAPASAGTCRGLADVAHAASRSVHSPAGAAAGSSFAATPLMDSLPLPRSAAGPGSGGSGAGAGTSGVAAAVAGSAPVPAGVRQPAAGAMPDAATAAAPAAAAPQAQPRAQPGAATVDDHISSIIANTTMLGQLRRLMLRWAPAGSRRRAARELQ